MGLLEWNKTQTRCEEIERSPGFPRSPQGSAGGYGDLELFERYRKQSGNYSHYKAARDSTPSLGTGITATPLWRRRTLTGVRVQARDDRSQPIPTTLLLTSSSLPLKPTRHSCSGPLSLPVPLPGTNRQTAHSFPYFIQVPSQSLPLREAIPGLLYLKRAPQPVSPDSPCFLHSIWRRNHLMYLCFVCFSHKHGLQLCNSLLYPRLSNSAHKVGAQ